MQALCALDVLLISLLAVLRCICSVHDQSVPITELSHRLLRSAVLSANGGECPFFLETESSCSESADGAQLVVATDRFPLPFVKKLSVYVRSFGPRQLWALAVECIHEITRLADYTMHSRNLLATLGLIVMLNAAATWGVFGCTLPRDPVMNRILAKQFRSFFVERALLIGMIVGRRADESGDELSVVACALIAWSALVWALESLALFAIYRLALVNEGQVLKVDGAFAEFKVLALAFSSLVTAATMLSMAYFTLGSLPFYSTLLSLEAVWLFSRWLYIMSRSASRVLHGEMRSGAGAVCVLSRNISHAARVAFYSFLVASLFLAYRKPLALLFVPRARFHLFKVFAGEPDALVTNRRARLTTQ